MISNNLCSSMNRIGVKSVCSLSFLCVVLKIHCSITELLHYVLALVYLFETVLKLIINHDSSDSVCLTSVHLKFCFLVHIWLLLH